MVRKVEGGKMVERSVDDERWHVGERISGNGRRVMEEAIHTHDTSGDLVQDEEIG